jgi:hypothetical protein
MALLGMAAASASLALLDSVARLVVPLCSPKESAFENATLMKHVTMLGSATRMVFVCVMPALLWDQIVIALQL